MTPPRQHVSPDHAARAAQTAIHQGDWLAAAQHLVAVADAARKRGQGARAAHCEQMAAELFRAAGSTDDALKAAQRTAAAEPGAPRSRFAARAEAAETHMARGESAAAVTAWNDALTEMAVLGLPLQAQATVWRRQATALAQAGEWHQAWASFDRAADMNLGTPHEDDAAWIDIEHAQTACAMGEADHARRVLARPRVLARAESDAHLRAERERALGDCAWSEGQADVAEQAATRAIDAALLAVAPVSFFGASVTLARAADARSDRAAAYRVLASAWVTLADLLGSDVAASWVAPVLEAFRATWGSQAFATVKSEHDRLRREVEPPPVP